MRTGRGALLRKGLMIAGLVALVAFAYWNLSQILGWLAGYRRGLQVTDWLTIGTLDPLHPYVNPNFRWSVPAAWIWSGIVQPMGVEAWAGLHVLALAATRNVKVILVGLATFPFWHDVAMGNMLTFAFLAAWWAVRGPTLGVVAFCILAALVPRPLMVPILAWLLVTQPVARIAFPAAALGVVLSAAAIGQLDDWIARLTGTSGAEFAAPWNLFPSRVLGWGWVILAWPVAVLAWTQRRFGIASVLFSPYYIPYYAVFLLLELDLRDTNKGWHRVARSTGSGGDVAGPGIHGGLDVIGVRAG